MALTKILYIYMNIFGLFLHCENYKLLSRITVMTVSFILNCNVKDFLILG